MVVTELEMAEFHLMDDSVEKQLDLKETLTLTKSMGILSLALDASQPLSPLSDLKGVPCVHRLEVFIARITNIRNSKLDLLDFVIACLEGPLSYK
jgi:hypothetical protein